MDTQLNIGNNNTQTSNDDTTKQVQVGSGILWIVGAIVAAAIVIASVTCASGDLSRGGYASPISCVQVDCTAAYKLFMKTNNPYLTDAKIEEILSYINKNAPKYFGTGRSLEVGKEMTLAVMAVENSFNTGSGDDGLAHGYMQIHKTAADETIEYHNLAKHYNLNDPNQNIDLGMAYIRLLLDTYNDRWKPAILAYNKGPRSVNKLISSRKIKSYGGYWHKVWKKKYDIHWDKGTIFREKEKNNS